MVRKRGKWSASLDGALWLLMSFLKVDPPPPPGSEQQIKADEEPAGDPPPRR